MNPKKCCVGLCAALLVATLLHGQASKSQNVAQDKPPKYYLELISIIDTKPHSYVLAVERRPSFTAPGVAYSSLASPQLWQFIGALPKGSSLVFAPGYFPVEQPSQPEWNDFREFCKNQGINFVVHTSSVYPDNE
ncbi:MAG TPA: hypothetical protein VNA16_05575 [Abditibacteriaceae bacterium]|nr:hypothetical protein [Abditibacteriaceae bacterium]